ncbi:hypothetical protein [Vibrio splendidus]|uniref:hypothetical protein n=1 Tax=Vibrio splendidus TaxID=29497 RepID=UPI0015E71BD3|nr:hypothetical protein [Vibrio splendidus]
MSKQEDKMIPVRVTAAIKEEWANYAELDDRTLTGLIRRAVNQYIKNNPLEEDE